MKKQPFFSSTLELTSSSNYMYTSARKMYSYIGGLMFVIYMPVIYIFKSLLLDKEIFSTVTITKNEKLTTTF